MGGTQTIVYILTSFGCAKAPKRIAPRPVCIIPVRHREENVIKIKVEKWGRGGKINKTAPNILYIFGA